MYISPYIQDSIRQPVPKKFNTVEDVIFDTKLTEGEKKKILNKMDFASTPPKRIQKN